MKTLLAPTDHVVPGGKLGHRDDIQGLRAVAVLLVVLWHAGVGALGGGYVGVDVFFVLSGFLITGLLIAGAEKRGYVSLREFYARRAKRILPAAALTLIATDLAAVYLMNFVRAKEAVLDSVWAAVFAANIQFAHRGADYFAQGEPPSPIQHYWSLAVEEQFYLVWPVLLALVLGGVGFARRRARPAGSHARAATTPDARIRLAIVIVLAGLASLVWSIYETHRAPGAAYFSTFTRIWELALGAALAIGASLFLHLSDRARALLGWAGILAIGVAAVMFSEATEFPGYAALLPTIGTALVIAAGIGNERSRGGVGALLGWAPMRYIGDRSYGFYLWHWPVILIAAAYAGHELSLGINLVLVAGAFLLSVASFRWVENPIRYAALRRPIATSGLLWGTSVGLVMLAVMFSLRSIADTAALAEAGPTGPLPALSPAPTQPGSAPTPGSIPAVVEAVRAAEEGTPIPSPLIPPVTQLLADRYPPIPDCWELRDDPRWLEKCTLFAGGSTGTIALIGDSHARQWLPAISWMAERDGWTVIPLLRMGCWPASYDAGGECSTWVRWAEEQVRTLQPDVVLLGGALKSANPEAIRLSAAGLNELVAALKPHTEHVVVMGDPPALGVEPVDCLLARDATLGTCTWTLTAGQISVYEDAERAVVSAGGAFMDTIGWFCFEDRCPTVVGRTVTHREDDHISSSYATELRALFRAAFMHAVPSAVPANPPGPTGSELTPRSIPPVVAAVRAAQQGAPIPSPLVPPVEKVLADRFPPIVDCWALRDDPQWLEECTLIAGGTTGTIVVLGDSHARSWLPAVSWMAERDGWTVIPLWHGGCWPPAYEAGGDCTTFLGWAEEQIRTLRPDVVLIGGEFRYGNPDAIRLMASGIRGLVAALEPLAGRVVVIGDPPALGFLPIDCLQAPDATLGTCTWTLTADQVSVYQGAERAAVSAGGAFLDTAGWFCFEGQCPAVIGRTVTRREDSHVTQSYAMELRARFRAAFMRAVSA